MPTNNTAATWWTEDRVESTVNPAYIHSHLRASEQEILQRSLHFGRETRNKTYLDWIVLKAKRLFLILVDAGVPDQIFGVIDDSFEDDDLPLAQHVVPSLRLSIEPNPALDKRFYRAQFKYLARTLQGGEHIRYADEENVPLTLVGLKSLTILNKDAVDAVRIPDDAGRVLVRKKLNLSKTTTEAMILSQIAELKKFSHMHILSVFASYVQGNEFYILSTPAGEFTLKAFLMDQPKSFDNLAKSDRRKRLINWTHCLANAIAWLHSNEGHHGAIRPSNILVTQDFEVSLGAMDGEGELCIVAKSDDLEAYQYAPPERWKRAATVQNTGQGKISWPSSGRSGKKVQEHDHSGDPSARRSESTIGQYSDKDGVYTFQSTSKSEFSRLQLSNMPTPGRMSTPTSRGTGRDGVDDVSVDSFGMVRRGAPITGRTAKPPSILSSHSSEGRSRSRSNTRRGVFISAPDSRTTVVQTWKSVQHDSFAADVFAIGAVIMDILTVLCKRTFSAFSRHRSKSNRNAGRGGGLADASFHANIGQVVSWAQLLSDDAQKKIKQDESRVLSAVGAILQIVVQCLDKDPEARPKSDVFERKLHDHITRFAGITQLHCASTVPEPVVEAAPARQRSSDRLTNQYSVGRTERLPSRMNQTRTPIMELDEQSVVDLPSPKFGLLDRPSTSRTVTQRIPPPTAISLSSFSSLHIDPDLDSMRSETIVARSRDNSHYSPQSDRSMDSRRPARHWRAPRPLFSDAGSDNMDNAASTYVDYSTSTTDDEREQIMRSYPMPPPSQPPPRKHLPKLPLAPAIITEHPRTGSAHRGQQKPPHQRPMGKRPPPVPSQLPSTEPQDDMIFYQQDERTYRPPRPPRPPREDSLPTGSEDEQYLPPPKDISRRRRANTQPRDEEDEPRVPPPKEPSRRYRANIQYLDEIEQEKLRAQQKLAQAQYHRNPIARHIAEQDRLYQHRI